MNPQELLELGNVLAGSGATREQIVEAIQEARGPNPQRQLTPEEEDIFGGAISRAVMIMPAFRDALALIRPFRDHTTATLYTDQHSRVGIGSLFFLPSVSPHRRATLLLHEAMHVLNNHFTRHVDFPIDQDSDNRAKDLEINSLLRIHPKTDLSMLVLPDQEPYGFPEVKSYEQYARLMKDKGLLPEGPPLGSGDPQPSGGGEPQSNEESSESSGEQADEQSSPPSEDGSGSGEREEESEGDGSKSESSEVESNDSNSDASDSDSDGDSSEGDGSESEDSDAEGSSSGDSESSDSSEGNSSEGSSGGSSGGDKDPESIADEAIEGSEQSDGTPSDKMSGSSCDHTTSEREQAADDLEIERASSAEQAVARNNTMARVREESAKAKAAGQRGALMMLQKMELAMEPSKVDWRVIFRNLMSNSKDAISMGRTNQTYKRVNKRLSTGEFIFPGMIRYEPSAIMAIDTSGSMSKEDFTFLLSELESIVKSALRSKDKFKAFCVDAKATEPKTVRSIRDLDLLGGGGTRMEMAIRSVELLKRKEIPDIFILATDGGTNWQAFKRELLNRKYEYRVVVLITQEYSYEDAKNTLRGLADVIDISQDGKGEIGR